MQTLQIISRHSTLAEAVENSGLDLSYNEEVARQYIRRTEKNVTEAFVVIGGVYFIFEYNGLKILNHFDPFIACLSDTPFCPVTIADDTITIGDPMFSKSNAARRTLASMGQIVA